MDVLAAVIDFKNSSRGSNSLNPVASQDLLTKNYYDNPINQTISGTTATLSVNNDTDFVLGTATVATTVTILATRTKPLVIKNVGTQDMTIAITSGQIDQAANISLRGGRKHSVTLYFVSGSGWIV